MVLSLIVCKLQLEKKLYLSMQDTIIIPNKVGQICKIVNPLNDENPDDVYIVSEDPTPFDLEDSIYITNLKDLQRNISTPLFAPQVAVIKGDITVVAESLETYISGWNGIRIG